MAGEAKKQIRDIVHRRNGKVTKDRTKQTTTISSPPPVRNMVNLYPNHPRGPLTNFNCNCVCRKLQVYLSGSLSLLIWRQMPLIIWEVATAYLVGVTVKIRLVLSQVKL